MTTAVMVTPPATGRVLVDVEHVIAVEVVQPIGLVEGVEVALAQVRGDGHGGELPAGRAAASQPVAPLTTVPVEPPNRNPRRASRWQARMVSASSTCTTSSTKDSSSSGGRTLVPSPGIIRRAGCAPKVTEPTLSTATIRTGRCHWRKNRAQPISVPVVPGPDEQHVQLGELAGDRRARSCGSGPARCSGCCTG